MELPFVVLYYELTNTIYQLVLILRSTAPARLSLKRPMRRNKQQGDARSFTVHTDMRNPLLEVTPLVPQALARLPELAANLFFSWHRPTRALFELLDRELWKQAGGNGRLMLRCMRQGALDTAAADPQYLSRYTQVLEAFDAYVSAPAPRPDAPLIAYFCAEYGFHESFPIYSGGLGV